MEKRQNFDNWLKTQGKCFRHKFNLPCYDKRKNYIHPQNYQRKDFYYNPNVKAG